jgi:hypothetical protein
MRLNPAPALRPAELVGNARSKPDENSLDRLGVFVHDLSTALAMEDAALVHFSQTRPDPARAMAPSEC